MFTNATPVVSPGTIAPVRVAIVEPARPDDPLQLPPGRTAEIVLRIDLVPADVERLVAAAAQVVVVDLRQTCTTQIRPALRLLRLLLRNLRAVAVTAPGDAAAAQIAIASGAIAHLGRDATQFGLLRAVQAASRGIPLHGETGQRAVCRMQHDAAP